VPALGFFDVFPFRYSYVADHFQYLACIGLISLAVSTGAAICQRAGQRGRDLGTLAAAIVLLILGASTWRQARIYQNPEMLWRDTIAKNPQSWMAHNNLGVVLRASGKIDEAIAHCEQALRIKPDLAEAHYNLGNIFLQEGKVSDAEGEFEQALRIWPDYYKAHDNLGNALVRLGKVTEAIAHYQQALKINPKYAEAHCNLGAALIATGKAPDARIQLEEALRLNPDLADAQNNLAWVLATLPPAQGGDPARAVSLAQRACELSGNRAPGDLDTLAVAYAAAGRFDAAVATARKAIDLARAAGQAQLVKEIEARLELYRSGRAYHPPVSAATSPPNP
jgi:tetratricopeptide (TPR) repeat protein